MTLKDFRDSPWGKSQQAYENSALNMRPAPEFATAEVIVASTYRASGFEGHAEGQVPTWGSKFDKASAKGDKADRDTHVGPDMWRTILYGALESPKQPNQSARRFLQLCPIVPDVALYSGSARLSTNSWNPGQLVERVVRLGSKSADAAQSLWAELHAGLTVGADDDIWARWLQGEFERRRTVEIDWKPAELGAPPTLLDSDKEGLRIPATQFCRDLTAVIAAKRRMTRRQWISLVEAVLRLGTVSHVLWLCDANDRLWRVVRDVLDGAEIPSEHEVRRRVFESKQSYLVHGAPALPIVRDFASRYLAARLGLNLVLWHLVDRNEQVQELSSAAAVVSLCEQVAHWRKELREVDVLDELAQLQDRQAQTVACKRGIGSNIVEFCRHALGQRQTADQNLRGYDQGYQLKKRAEYASAPWVVSLGPAALLALVHCCLAEAAGPRSVHRLCEHLAWYGMDVDLDDIAKSDLGKKLRMLGLVLDSPDAESGMLLVPPFEMTQTAAGGQAQ
jgi:hypothetical protein